jgi:hypothetical protein
LEGARKKGAQKQNERIDLCPYWRGCAIVVHQAAELLRNEQSYHVTAQQTKRHHEHEQFPELIDQKKHPAPREAGNKEQCLIQADVTTGRVQENYSISPDGVIVEF